MLTRRQLNPTASSLKPNSSCSSFARCGAESPASKYALPPVSAKPKPSMG